MKEQALSRADAFQTRIREMEAEKSRRDSELRLLRDDMHAVSKPSSSSPSSSSSSSPPPRRHESDR